ncbi:MAG: hypothetical protein ACRD5J_14105, partial [Nitrososphaeraceae archaeon]
YLLLLKRTSVFSRGIAGITNNNLKEPTAKIGSQFEKSLLCQLNLFGRNRLYLAKLNGVPILNL